MTEVNADRFTFNTNGTIVTATAGRFGNLWRLNVADTEMPINIALAALFTSSPGIALWHERIGHLGERSLRCLERITDNVDLSEKPSTNTLCETCAKVNVRAQPYTAHCEPGRFPLDLVYTDVGQFPVTS